MTRLHLFLTPLRLRIVVCLLFTFLIAVLSINACAQTTPTIYAMSLVKKSAVILRWVPADYKTWKLGNRYGYKVERIISTIGKADTNLFTTGATVLAPAIVPFAAADSNWKRLQQTNANASLIYGDLYEPSQKTPTKKEESILWGFLMLTTNTSATIAKGAGLYFKDSTVTNTATYAYRISIVKNKETAGVKPQVIVVNAMQFPQSPVAPDSVRVKFGDRVATLKWHVPANSEYDSYNIERSEDSSNFKKINKSPYVLMASQYEKNKTLAVYYDSIGKNNTPFYYRIKGITPFGEEGPASKIVRGQGKSAFISYPLIDSAKVVDNKKTVLSWHMPTTFPQKLLKGYAIARSATDKNGYRFLTTTLLSSGQQRYEDINPLPVNYYKIFAISVAGDTTSSFAAFAQLQDLTPPQPPVGLNGKADAKGIVNLTWEANKESDLMGYRIFRSNSLTEEFVEVSRKIITVPTFTDTIAVRTLTKNIYYQLTAVDKVHNNSDYSTPIKIKRPDVIPPVEPTFTSITQSAKGILLKWIPSSSDDIVRYELVRYTINTNTPVTLKTWQVADNTSTFSDSTVNNNTKYTYLLIVTDDSNNQSKKISAVTEYVSGIPPVISNITYVVDRKQNRITLSWNYTVANIYSYILYKAKKGEPLRIYKTLNAITVSLEDMDSQIGNTYVYKLKAVFNNGTETPLSKALEIVY